MRKPSEVELSAILERVQEELEDDSECKVAFQTLGIYPSNSHINY